MKPLKVFIDVEFTNFVSPEIVSIGLVAETGEETYFELDYDLNKCSEFVKHTVLPLLNQIPHSKVPLDTLPMKIISWFKIVKHWEQDIEICYCDKIDIDLFRKIFLEFPLWIKQRDVQYQVSLLLHADFFVTNSVPEHHALYDARANAYAFREKIF